MKERLAKSLGQVLELSSAKHYEGKKLVKNKNLPSSRGTPIDQYDDDDDDDDNDNDNDDDDDDDDDDNFTSSPLLFPPPRPRWNVDILRGAYFDFEPIGSTSAAASNNNLERSEQKKKDTERRGNDDDEGRLVNAAQPRGKNDDGGDIRPFPIVEFVQQQSSRSSGHVLIRLQGCPVPNEDFGDTGSQYSRRQQQQQPVTLVFDACFQNPTPLKNQVTS